MDVFARIEKSSQNLFCNFKKFANLFCFNVFFFKKGTVKNFNNAIALRDVAK